MVVIGVGGSVDGNYCREVLRGLGGVGDDGSQFWPERLGRRSCVPLMIC